MDILNFISWIASKKRVVTSAPDDALIPIGIRTETRDDKYTTVAIKKSDLITSAPTTSCCSVDLQGNYIAGNSSTNTVVVPPGGTHDIPDFSGMLLVNDHYDGSVELWIAGGGNNTILLNSTPYGPGPGDLTINGGVNGYTWTNVNNQNGPFTFTVIKTRDSA